MHKNETNPSNNKYIESLEQIRKIRDYAINRTEPFDKKEKPITNRDMFNHDYTPKNTYNTKSSNSRNRYNTPNYIDLHSVPWNEIFPEFKTIHTHENDHI